MDGARGAVLRLGRQPVAKPLLSSPPVPAVRIHNSLTRATAPVGAPGAPLAFYSCGPTVYDDAYIGNFRSFLDADILRRTL